MNFPAVFMIYYLFILPSAFHQNNSIHAKKQTARRSV